FGLVVSPYFSSEDDGTRTRNHRIDRPHITRANTLKNKSFAASDTGASSAGRSKQQGEEDAPDAELAALMAAWPTLPEHIRAAIRALVGTVATAPLPS